MIRRELTDGEWSRIEKLVPGKKGDKGRSGEDNRLFVDAVLWILRTGAPWRDLPREFGNWNSTYVRFRRWMRKGIWERLFRALADDPDIESSKLSHIDRNPGSVRSRISTPKELLLSLSPVEDRTLLQSDLMTEHDLVQKEESS